ncbi:MAG: hypothetical protein E6K03_01580 [Methanobacteriota archaeon]|nr:MAG: hypothetical protein E6K03_01580 [Euryarchaeota archaeon]
MQGERYQNTIALLLTVLVFASIPLIVNFLGGWFLWAPVLAALAVLPAAFLREAELDTGLEAPAQVRAALAANLRGEGLEVGAEPDAIWVRIDALSAVRIRARTTDRGTVLSSQARATIAGWLLLLGLVASVVGSLPAVALTLVLFRRANRFARARAPAAFGGKGGTAVSSGDEVRAMLVGSLSSALRIAREASDAQRKAYTDALTIIAVAAFTSWTALLIGLFVALNGFNLITGQWDVPIVGATGGTLVLSVVLLSVVRRRFLPRLARYRAWIDRLSDAFDREMSPEAAEPSAASTFELLAEASTQVPDWLDAQRRAGLSSDPATSFAILILTLFVSTTWIYRAWKRREDARLAHAQAAWDAHVKSLRARMDHFLEEM